MTGAIIPSGSKNFAVTIQKVYADHKTVQPEQVIAESRKSANDSAVTKRQAREEEIDSIFRQLQESHDDAYSVPQLRLWARMVIREHMMT